MKKIVFLTICLTLIGAGCKNIETTKLIPEPDTNTKQEQQGIAVGEFNPSDPNNETKTITSSEIEGLKGPYDFTVEIPARWEVEAVPGIESINFYNTTIGESKNLEKSQIFMRHFTANDFLTLGTVNIFTQIPEDVNGRNTITYDIEKKANFANFPSQPSWRNERHLVTDIRVSKDNPSIFYVFGRRPSLDPVIFERFINSLTFTQKKTL